MTNVLIRSTPRIASWAELGSLANLAPSPHNTQPFRLRPLDDATADIVLLTDRLLPREDHGNLYMASAFGTFAAALVRAGRHFGLDIRVDSEPDIDPATLHCAGPIVLLGRATIDDTCEPQNEAVLLEARRTARGPYDDRVVDASTIGVFEGLSSAYHHRFTAYDDARTVRDVLQLNAQAVIDNLQLDDEREEIARWYRIGATPVYGDGLWQGPMQQSAWKMRAAFAVPRLFALPGVRALTARQYVRTQHDTRNIGLLCGAFTRWPDLVAAGELLLELWLAMTRAGVRMHPMGSMLTNPRYAAIIAERFGVSDCWLVFRFGYAAMPPRAPRLATIQLEAVDDE